MTILPSGIINFFLKKIWYFKNSCSYFFQHIIHKTIYNPYSDTGLFGSYLHGNEVHAPQMIFMSQLILTENAQFVSNIEKELLIYTLAFIYRWIKLRCSEPETNYIMTSWDLNLENILPTKSESRSCNQNLSIRDGEVRQLFEQTLMGSSASEDL